MKIILFAVSIPVLLGSAFYLAPASPHAETSPMPAAEPADAEVLRTALLCGLGPEVLIISGCDAADAQAMVAAIRAEAEDVEALRTAMTSIDRLNRQAATLQEEVRKSPFDEDLRTSLGAAREDARTTAETAATLREQIREAALAAVTPAEAESIRACIASAGRKVPPEFHVTRCSSIEWREVERALIAERRTSRLGETLDQEHARVLSDIRARPEVFQASLRLTQVDEGPVRQVFDGLRD